jgi:hypothetical protein
MELAYLAGFFDGEGCITIARIGKISYVLLVTISQRKDCSKVLELFKNRFGGSIVTQKVTKYVTHDSNDVHRYNLTGKAAADLLEVLLPLLIVKKAQAKMGIAFFRTNPHSTFKTKVDLLEYREMFLQKLKQMKKFPE